MWLLRKVVPNFWCIADFRKDNAKAIREVFKTFVKLCNKAGLLSQQSVIIDGTKFRAVNEDKKSYVVGSAKKVLLNAEGKISEYMKEMDEADTKEARPGALGKEDITKSTGLFGAQKKAALGVETLEGIADRGYGKNDGVLQCLLNGDTPATHPQQGGKMHIRRRAPEIL